VKIPNEVTIAGYTYKVIFCDKVESDCDKDKYALGTCDPLKLEINILKGQTKIGEFSTFLHEVIEAVNEHYAINMKHQQIIAFENGMYQFLVGSGIVKI